MKRVKYLGGLGEEININFPGPVVIRFTKGQEIMLKDEWADQLLEDTSKFKEMDASKTISKAKEAEVVTGTVEALSTDEEVVSQEAPNKGEDK